MNKFLFIPFSIFFLIFGCKPSQKTRKELIQENTLLKNQIAQINQNRLTQNDVALELTNMNVVYRGVANPIRATINNAEKIEISGIGVSKDKDGNYNLRPGSGLKVKVFIKGFFKSGDSISFEKELRIKDLARPIGTINGLGDGNDCPIKLSKSKIMNGTIGWEIPEFSWEMKRKVLKFNLYTSNDTLTISGNRFNPESKEIIQNLNIGDTITIQDIRVDHNDSHYKLKSISPVLIQIIQD
ncbi:hypothetical protein LRR18_03260 [Mangrovimonas sp. AS39]|uniref:GldM family protein n=1 Tax=Mangrovimonas futianensis TaxID=2895523 RepID=UPI001E29BCCC|nr:GldM family protein [Mangrovimonas futianensis]MCF1190590.1 hypothetical protein [Mangrovimonas futianensis]MCF1193658.1 hypothetical protein [Mangrovimonas futianensis]MCF1420622.1 hypothetical protein [Mangrovimonas futianensis]